MARPSALLGLMCLLGSACTTTVEQVPAGVEEARATHAERAAEWTVQVAGEACGSIVMFREPGGQHRTIHVVRNRHGQDMGFVDAYGRSWRRRVHAAEPELLGTGPLLTGALRILDREDAAEAELVLASVVPARTRTRD